MNDTLDPSEIKPVKSHSLHARAKKWLTKYFPNEAEATLAVPVAQNASSIEHQAVISKNLMEVHDLTVADVMTPRADIISVEFSMTLEEALKTIVCNPFSRLPVYRKELDDVIGIIHIKDILDSLVSEAGFDMGRLIRNTKFVVPSMRVLDLLLEMRQTRVHMAIVVDEYGGVDGVVTIEDLLEQIVGDIEDERDYAPTQMIELANGIWITDARLTLDQFEKIYGEALTDEEKEEADTLGGLVTYLADRVLQRGETITHDNGIAFDVLEADKRRVKRLRIRRLAPLPEVTPPVTG